VSDEVRYFSGFGFSLDENKVLTVKSAPGFRVSDGYHTFDDLYDHRFELFLALCRSVNHSAQVWRSLLHSDGSRFEGWFIMGIHTAPGSQLTYHLPISRWEETAYATTYEHAPPFDGHTASDVLERLRAL
jgi:hypothetical protein